MSVTTMKPLSGPGQTLPLEVLKMVLAQLPHTFLITTCTSVCKHWRDVIMNPAFLPWKKLYHRYKVAPTTSCPTTLLSQGADEDGGGAVDDDDDLTARQVVKRLCQHHDITAITTCLITIIRAVGQLHKAPHGSVANLLECHPLYAKAEKTLAIITESKSSPLSFPSPLSIWHYAATIIVLSPDVWHIFSLITMMLHPGSLFSPCEVVEGLYSMALFFLHCTYSNSIKLPTRYHYQLFYALYLYENEVSVMPSEQQPPGVKGSPSWGQGSGIGQQYVEQVVQRTSSLQPTHEQLRIISHNLEPHHVVKIVALAGTGKTTTLLHLCQRQPNQRFLMMVYNKSAQMHCASIFPENTTVRTVHAMAFADIGKRYKDIGKFTNNLSAYSLVDFLEHHENAVNRLCHAALVKNTLEKYMHSADQDLTLQHVPDTDKQKTPLEDDYRQQVLSDAVAVWTEMIRCTESQAFPMTQDGQLKLWQLSCPKMPGYDVLLVDDGQDMNPPMLAVILDQSCAKVIVGDPYQQIYSFRGAINALETVPSTHTFYLTQSFRFGPEVSYMANCILESLAMVQKRTLVGGNKQDSIVTTPLHLEASQSNTIHRKAYLGRSNFEVYVAALDICQRDEYAHLRMGFAGGIDKYGLDIVMDIYWLSVGETAKIKNRLVAGSSDVESLMHDIEELDDQELCNKIQMYRHSREDTPRHVQLLNERCSSTKDSADVTFSTIHQAKGLEWDHVVLLEGGNFAQVLMRVKDSTPILNISRDEINLLYVAVTRAKKLLNLNKPLLQVLRLSRERLEVLVDGTEASNSKCLQCTADIDWDETVLVTKVSGLMVSESKHLTGGYVCHQCATNPQAPPFEIRDTVADHLYPGLNAEHSRWARANLFTGQTSQI